MTCGAPNPQAVPTGIALALFLVLAGAFACGGKAALAQQGWQPTVTTGAVVPNAPVRAQAKTAAPRSKPAVAEIAGKQPAPPPAAPSGRLDPPSHPVPQTFAGIETGSIKGAQAEEYCANISDAAADARFAWQKKLLADMEQEIAKRIAVLEEKTAEYQKWLARRDEFSQKANETLLRIYARMRPDAAATQLAALDEETAAAVLIKLEPRMASLILNEMDSTQAVRLAATISGAGKVLPPAGQRTAAEARAK